VVPSEDSVPKTEEISNASNVEVSAYDRKIENTAFVGSLFIITRSAHTLRLISITVETFSLNEVTFKNNEFKNGRVPSIAKLATDGSAADPPTKATSDESVAAVLPEASVTNVME